MIFLHSSFRVSSTWLWSRFRRCGSVVAYYEIFNKELSTITPDLLNSVEPSSWRSKHPAGKAYFLEYAPLIRDTGGVENFTTEMTSSWFVPSSGLNGVLTIAEKVYLSRLIAHAESCGKVPILTATRSLGRVKAIKEYVPGFHVILYRNLFQQWCSYFEQAFCGNSFFLETIPEIVSLNRHDQILSFIHETFPLGKPSLDNKNYFFAFILMHLYFYSRMADSADLLLDINRLSDDSTYRDLIEMEVRKHSGLDIDLSTAKNSIAFSFFRPACRKAFMDQIQSVAEQLIFRQASDVGRDFGQKLLDDFCREYSAYEFYAGSLEAAVGPEGLLDERATLLDERAALLDERAALLDERAALLGEREVFRREIQSYTVALAAMRTSTSWKLTGPLRAIRGMLNTTKRFP